MKVLKNFRSYMPDIDNQFLGDSVIYLKSDDGQDWYKSQSEFSPDTLKLSYDDRGVISSCSKDVSMLWPVGLSVAEVEESLIPEGFNIELGWVYSDGKVYVRNLSDEEVQSVNDYKKEELMRNATASINPLQDAVDMEIATNEETEVLKQWKIYRISVNRIDTTQKEINWPDIPA